MMKKSFVLSALMLIAAFGMSQDDYPKLTLIKGDTLVLFTPIQVRKMNVTFLELDKNLALNTSLTEELQLNKDLILNLNTKNDNLTQQIDMHKSINEEKDFQIEKLELSVKKKDRKIKLLKKTRNLFALGGVVIGGLGGYYLSQKL